MPPIGRGRWLECNKQTARNGQEILIRDISIGTKTGFLKGFLKECPSNRVGSYSRLKPQRRLTMLNRRNELFKKEKTNTLRGLDMTKIIFLSVAVLFLMVGCGGGTAPQPTPVTSKAPLAQTKKVEPVKAAEKAEKKELEKREVDLAYNPTGKPDPFKPFFQLARDRGSKGPLTPLQEYDLSQLKLVAVITIPEGDIALVEDSQGKGYFVKKGTVIGKNDGKVKQILKDTVIVEEIYEDVMGQRKANEVSLFLHQSEKEGQES